MVNRRVQIVLLALAGVALAPTAHAQEDPARRRAAEDAKRANEDRARAAADSAVKQANLVNADVSRAQLGQLGSPTTPGGGNGGAAGPAQGRQLGR